MAGLAELDDDEIVGSEVGSLGDTPLPGRKSLAPAPKAPPAPAPKQTVGIAGISPGLEDDSEDELPLGRAPRPAGQGAMGAKASQVRRGAAREEGPTAGNAAEFGLESGSSDEVALPGRRNGDTVDRPAKGPPSSKAPPARGGSIAAELGLDESDSDDVLKLSLETPSESLTGSGSLSKSTKKRANPLSKMGQGSSKEPALRSGLFDKDPDSFRAAVGLGGGGGTGGIRGPGLAKGKSSLSGLSVMQPKGAARFGGNSGLGAIDWSQASDPKW